MKAPICNACNSATYPIYTLPLIPAFQNKLFATAELAQAAPGACVALVGCPCCGLVFNARFDNDLMDYDGDYQNAQDHSPSFQSYLDGIADLILAKTKPSNRIVEIGCGKGFFLETLKARGANIKGFDPSYEGENPDIVKAFFDAYANEQLRADAVIMRHTLEHIEAPYAFLRELKRILPSNTVMFIKIPRFEWIVAHHAFWDIFHEHCNYFSEDFFVGAFGGKCHITRVFSEQYMMVEARIGDLLDTLQGNSSHAAYNDIFSRKMAEFAETMSCYKTHYVWGAGAKGIAFSNILDPEKQKIRALIDINPQKQNCYISLTGHPCVSPASVHWGQLTQDDCLWIMNSQYKDEILHSLPATQCAVIVLGEETCHTIPAHP